MSSRRQNSLTRANRYLQSSLKHITELITCNKFHYRGGRYRQVSLYSLVSFFLQKRRHYAWSSVELLSTKKTWKFGDFVWYFDRCFRTIQNKDNGCLSYWILAHYFIARDISNCTIDPLNGIHILCVTWPMKRWNTSNMSLNLVYLLLHSLNYFKTIWRN